VQTNASTTEDFIRVLGEIKVVAPLVVTPTALPEFSADQLHVLGADVIIFANVVMRTIIKSVSETLSNLKLEQRLNGVQSQIAPLEELFKLTRAYDWLDRTIVEV
jgi:2-methylisocitrate lyase-like PEP mutase family enzyme